MQQLFLETLTRVNLFRVTAKDTDLVMPPPEAGEPLSDKERALLRQWINSGAEYEPHWAYTRISRPVIPNVVDTSWPQPMIDLLASERRLEADEADRMTLARRLALDLTGLPVSPNRSINLLQMYPRMHLKVC